MPTVLRGIFLVTEREVQWFYQDGASMLAPDCWESFRDLIASTEPGIIDGLVRATDAALKL